MSFLSVENIIHICILTTCIVLLILFICPWLLSLHGKQESFSDEVQVEELGEINTPADVKNDVDLTNSMEDPGADAEYDRKNKEMQQQVDRESNLTDASKQSQNEIEQQANTKEPDPDPTQPQTSKTPKKVSDVAEVNTSDEIGI